jgi:hypothetical protein
MEHGDVVPLVNSIPAPDGVINTADFLVTRRKAQGLVYFWSAGPGLAGNSSMRNNPQNVLFCSVPE